MSDAAEFKKLLYAQSGEGGALIGGKMKSKLRKMKSRRRVKVQKKSINPTLVEEYNHDALRLQEFINTHPELSGALLGAALIGGSLPQQLSQLKRWFDTYAKLSTIDDKDSIYAKKAYKTAERFLNLIKKNPVAFHKVVTERIVERKPSKETAPASAADAAKVAAKEAINEAAEGNKEAAKEALKEAKEELEIAVEYLPKEEVKEAEKVVEMAKDVIKADTSVAETVSAEVEEKPYTEDLISFDESKSGRLKSRKKVAAGKKAAKKNTYFQFLKEWRKEHASEIKGLPSSQVSELAAAEYHEMKKK